MGYFSLIDQVGTFVFLDSVQFAKRTWQQRNQIKSDRGPQWLTLPVLSKDKRDQTIQEVQLAHNENFVEKMIRSIAQNYSKAPYYKEYAEPTFEIMRTNNERLAELNINLITWMSGALGISGCRFLRSSEMEVSGKKADLLADICQKLGVKHYLSAIGSKEYIDQSDAFQTRGITVRYNYYEHPRYTQLNGDFLPYMCALDLMFNKGPESLEIIRTGAAPA